VPRTEAPVDVQLLAQQRRNDHPGPVMHPAFLLQLAHARVHDRHPGPALPPGVERLAVVAPAHPGRPVVLGRDGRKRGCHLVEEVAPGELAGEFAGPGRLGQLKR
jgi:hypothetical protein